ILLRRCARKGDSVCARVLCIEVSRRRCRQGQQSNPAFANIDSRRWHGGNGLLRGPGPGVSMTMAVTLCVLPMIAMSMRNLNGPGILRRVQDSRKAHGNCGGQGQSGGKNVLHSDSRKLVEFRVQVYRVSTTLQTYPTRLVRGRRHIKCG